MGNGIVLHNKKTTMKCGATEYDTFIYTHEDMRLRLLIGFGTCKVSTLGNWSLNFTCKSNIGKK